MAKNDSSERLLKYYFFLYIMYLEASSKSSKTGFPKGNYFQAFLMQLFKIIYLNEILLSKPKKYSCSIPVKYQYNVKMKYKR